MIEYLDKHPNKELEFKFSKLKLKIMELKELEQNFVEKKDYANAQKIADELQLCDEEYKTVFGPLISEASTSSQDSSSVSIIT
jgi:protein-arginine kinase activator protein McsA